MDVKSSSDCLAVYDMMEDESNDYTAVQVCAQIFGIKKEHKHLDLFTDARSERGMLRDYVCDNDKLTDEQRDDEALLSKATTHAEKKR